jgi:cell division protein FtsB
VTPPLRRHLVRAAAAALFLALGLSVAGGLRRYMARRGENAQLARKVAEAEAALARKKSLLALSQQDDDLLEGEARRQLGMIGEGEIEFRFVKEGEDGGERMDVAPPAS